MADLEGQDPPTPRVRRAGRAAGRRAGRGPAGSAATPSAAPAGGSPPPAQDPTPTAPTTVDDAGAPADTPAVAARRRRGGAPWSVVAVALGLALVSLAVAVGALLTGRSVDGSEQTEALDAARELTVALTSYDSTRLDDDFARVLERATDPFEGEYRETTEQLRPTFEEQQATASGVVVGAGIEQYEPGRAVAVVAVDQEITSQGQPTRTEQNRIRMTLQRVDGTWLIAAVERL